MIHNFNQFLTHRSLLESQILERAEGDFFPEENIEISDEDIEVPMRPPDKSSSSDKSGTLSVTSAEITPDVVEYTVKSGDTLSKIARSLGMEASDWRKIYTLNASVIGRNPGNIRVGMKLKVPTQAAKFTPDLPNVVEYTVKSGDTLSKIALSLGMKATDWKKIYDPNASVIGPDPNKIRVGMKLKVPKGSSPSTRTPSPTQSKTDRKQDTKSVQVSDKTNSEFMKTLKLVKSSIDSSVSKVLFNIHGSVGCAGFVNEFTDAVSYVNDAWKARDTFPGTVIYDVFTGLNEGQIATCINLWKEIYKRQEKKVLDGKDLKRVKWRLGQGEGEKIRDLIKNLLEKNPLDATKLKIGDICGIFYPASFRQEQAFYEAGVNYFTDANGDMGKGNVPGRNIKGGKSWTMNSHVGIVGAIENGNPVIFHAIPKYSGLAVNIWADGVDKIHGGGKIVWVKRPNISQSMIDL